jgi:alkanesulfonate monooxygenase
VLAEALETRREPVEVFATCPQSKDVDSREYLRRVAEVARWSDLAGYRGILVYTDNAIVDPWLVSQLILQSTTTLCPLVAVQPIYMHPYTAAKMVASLGGLYGRRLCLNMVAGGFKQDLEQLGDPTPHDERYARLEEYARVIKGLLAASAESRTFSFNGRHYTLGGAKVIPALPAGLQPDFFISGSSDAGRQTAAALDAVAVHYPDPANAQDGSTLPAGIRRGARVGIIARATSEAAWRIAEARFPPDRRGEITHQLAVKTSDSSWHRQLSERASADERQGCYWLRPFRTYKTFCPYLVGSVGEVAGELRRYLEAGFEAFILDVPPDEEELAWTGATFRAAAAPESADGRS